MNRCYDLNSNTSAVTRWHIQRLGVIYCKSCAPLPTQANSHHLFVWKDGAIVNERQTVGGVAVATHSRLSDASAIHLHTGAVSAHLALEESLLHLGDELWGADHHAADSDELIDVYVVNTKNRDALA